MPTVFVDGAVGTTGLEIRDRLAGRREIDLAVLPEKSRRDPAARAEALNDADFVILCLPDDAARDAVGLIRNDRTRIIDASTAFRTSPDWVYGFAELEPDAADRIHAARRVSNPGCYPTGFLALVRPLTRIGLIPADWATSINAVSGYSGGGKAMIAAFEGSDGAEATDTAYRLYALPLAHKHVPEMKVHAHLDHGPIFLPAVARTYRGMICEVPLPLHALPGCPTLADAADALAHAYRDQPLIDVLADDDGLVLIEENAGTDRLSLRVRGNDATGQARLIATLDNLGKGAAGAAVQNLNIMAGLDPVAGLNLPPRR